MNRDIFLVVALGIVFFALADQGTTEEVLHTDNGWPQFLYSMYRPNVKKDVPIGSAVLTIAASHPTGDRIVYSLRCSASTESSKSLEKESECPLFQVDSLTGLITVSKSLSDKINTYIPMTAVATDGQGHSATVPVYIYVY